MSLAGMKYGSLKFRFVMWLPLEFGEAVVVAGDGVVLAATAKHVGHQHSLANAVVDVDAVKI